MDSSNVNNTETIIEEITNNNNGIQNYNSKSFLARGTFGTVRLALLIPNRRPSFHKSQPQQHHHQHEHEHEHEQDHEQHQLRYKKVSSQPKHCLVAIKKIHNAYILTSKTTSKTTFNNSQNYNNPIILRKEANNELRALRLLSKHDNITTLLKVHSPNNNNNNNNNQHHDNNKEDGVDDWFQNTTLSSSSSSSSLELVFPYCPASFDTILHNRRFRYPSHKKNSVLIVQDY